MHLHINVARNNNKYRNTYAQKGEKKREIKKNEYIKNAIETFGQQYTGDTEERERNVEKKHRQKKQRNNKR